MKTTILAGIAALAIAGSTAVYAQHGPWSHEHARLSPQDRVAFADARIAAVKAGLELTPDQQKLWPPVEQAVRDFAKLRIDRANARMNAGDDQAKAATQQDPVARLRQRADRMAETAAALKKIADAADPLYKTLDEGQKRRLKILTHMGHHRFGGQGWRRHHEGRFGRDGDHFGAERQRFDHGDRDGNHGGAGDWHGGQESGRL